MSITGVIAPEKGPVERFKSLFSGSSEDAANFQVGDEKAFSPSFGKWITGLIAAPVVYSALSSQAHHLTDPKKDKNSPEPEGFAAAVQNSIKFFSKGFFTFENIVQAIGLNKSRLSEQHKKILSSVKNFSGIDLRKNFRSSFKGLSSLMDLDFAKRATGLIFDCRNMLGNFFIKKQEGSGHGLSSVWETFYPRVGVMTSGLGSLLAIPGSLISVFSKLAYKEDSSVREGSEFLTKLGRVFLPVSSNLGAFQRMAMALKMVDSGEASSKEAKEFYNVGNLNIIQGLGAMFLSPLSIPASIRRLKDIYGEGKEKIPHYLEDVSMSSIKILKEFGRKLNIDWFEKINSFETTSRFVALGSQVVNSVADSASAISQSILNMPIIYDIAKHFMVTDPDAENRIVADLSNHENDVQKARHKEYLDSLEQNQFFHIRKSDLTKDLDHIARPLQSTLMLLPMAAPNLQDEYIQNHGILPLRLLDKGIGLASTVLALPSFVKYLFSARLPQMVSVYYGHKQRIAQNNDDYLYSAVKDIAKLQERLITGPILRYIPGARALADQLSQLTNRPDAHHCFARTEYFQEMMEELEQKAQEQEQYVKVPTAIKAARDFIKSMITNKVTAKVFRASVDAANLSAAQKSKKQIYDLLTKLETGLKTLIPGLGAVVALPATLMKRAFKIRGLEEENPAQMKERSIPAEYFPQTAAA